MSNREDDNFIEHLLIDDAEGKLPESVFLETAEVEWPALRGLSNRFARLPHRTLKFYCRGRTLIPILGHGRQIFLFRLWMNSKRTYSPSISDCPFRRAAPHDTVFT